MKPPMVLSLLPVSVQEPAAKESNVSLARLDSLEARKG
jgi:hypothetical protein